MTDRGPLPSFLMDMDGVLVHEEQAIPGAGRFLEALQTAGLPFLVLTNNSIYSQRDLAARLARSGGSSCLPKRSGPRRWPPPSSSTRSVPVGQRT
jgi:ribonucleotide monophosphatase NagD (HAD superfamily)